MLLAEGETRGAESGAAIACASVGAADAGGAGPPEACAEPSSTAASVRAAARLLQRQPLPLPGGCRAVETGRAGICFAPGPPSRQAGHIDIAAMKGSGPHGRIVQRDIESARKIRRHTAAAGAWPSAPATSGAGQAVSLASPMADDKILALYKPDSYEVVPHDGMRKRDRPAPDPIEADHAALLSVTRLRASTSCCARANGSTPPRPRMDRRPTNCRSTISSSRRWRWRCSAFRPPTRHGPKAACCAIAIPMSALRWRSRAACSRRSSSMRN